MAVPLRHKDVLKSYIDDASQAAWARDLVSYAIQTGGFMTDTEQSKVLDELLNNAVAPTVPLPATFTASENLEISSSARCECSCG